LNELFDAHEYIYKRDTYFIYGYLVVSLATMKWCPPEGREIALVSEDQPLALIVFCGGLSGIPTTRKLMRLPLLVCIKKCLLSPMPGQGSHH